MNNELNRSVLGASPDHPVVRRLTSLEPRRQREVACALSLLWDEFLLEMGGPAGLTTRDISEQAQYIRFLGLAAERIRLNGGRDKEHYALAPELMGLYAHSLRVAVPSNQDRAVAALALAFAARGGSIRKASKREEPTRPAPRAVVLDPVCLSAGRSG